MRERKSGLWEILRPDQHRLISLIGAGGKSSLLKNLGREGKDRGLGMILSVTTRLGIDQESLADRVVYAELVEDFTGRVRPAPGESVLAAARPLPEAQKIAGLTLKLIESLAAALPECPLLVEADGAAGGELKIPGPGEPVIPAGSSTVVAVTACRAIGAAVDQVRIHRRSRFVELFGEAAERIDPALMAALISSPGGMFKGTPVGSARYWLINQADTPLQAARAADFAAQVLKQGVGIDAVLIGSLESGSPFTVLSR